LTSGSFAHTNAQIITSGIIRGVDILGFDVKPEYTRTKDALIIQTKGVESANPVVFKIYID